METTLPDATAPAAAAPAPAPLSPITAYLEELRARLLPLGDGEVATYIPALAAASPDWFGISVCTAQGALYGAGDVDLSFSIQSVSKPFAYGDALRRLGRDAVLERVGVEPTGEAFNAIVLDEARNRPFNPMVNAGAIAVSALIDGADAAAREANLLGAFSRFAGRPLGIDEAVYRSEDETGHRNRAIAYLMLNSGMIARPPAEALETYFKQCAISVTCADLAVMAATLANDGVNPVTGERALGSAEVRDVLTVMMTCGMYDYAGQWAFEVGLPAKSGVSGCIVAVVPGQVGFAVYSPPLDGYGNSVRGVEACKALSRAFGLHVFGGRPNARNVVRRSWRADVVRSRRARPASEQERLEREGRAVAAFELQDALYFGSAERLLGRLEELGDEVRYAVLDFRRVRDADGAAIDLLRARVAEPGGPQLIFCGLDPDGPLAGLRAAMAAVPGGPLIFDDLDAALDWCESRLLESRGTEPRLALDSFPLFAGLAPEDLRAVEGVVETMEFDEGQTIIRAGDEAQLMFVVVRGSVSIWTPGPGRRRVAAFGPGMVFGEMAILDGGRRSADVIADARTLCYGLSVNRLRELAADRPAILSTILGNLARDLSERLRRTNQILLALD